MMGHKNIHFKCDGFNSAPPVIGALKDLTGSYTSGMYFCCAALVPVSVAAVWELAFGEKKTDD